MTDINDIAAILAGQQQEEEIYPHDLTEDFIEELIHGNADNPNFGLTIRIDGMKRSGKTILALITSVELMYTDSKRTCAVMTDSSNLAENLNRFAPAAYNGRFYRAKRIEEIKPNSVVVVDEGANLFDAKEALKLEKREVGKAGNIISHQRVIFIICSTRAKGIMAALRENADIKIYKRVNDEYINTSRDWFVKKWADVLPYLTQQQALIKSNYFYFNNKLGGIELDATSRARWAWLVSHDDEISRNMAEESLAVEKTRDLNLQKKIEELADLLIEKFGKNLKNTYLKKGAKAWIRKHYPKKLYLLNHWTEVIEHCYLKLYEQGMLLKQTRSKTPARDFDIKVPKVQINNNKIPIFADFVHSYYSKNLHIEDTAEKEYIIEILYRWAKGQSVGEIQHELGGSPNKINRIIKTFRTGTKLENDDLRLAFALEYYIAETCDATRGGGISDPDEWFHTPEGDLLGPGEVKLINKRYNQISFHKFSKNHNNLSLNPSYLYCKEHKIEQFPLFYFIGGGWQWSQYPICVPVKIEGDLILSVEKQDLELLVQNFLTFNKNDFFGGGKKREK